jgi:predicted MFS family arabinose efflux permease
VLADAWGFETVFALAAACGVAGVALLALRVREPRHARA